MFREISNYLHAPLSKVCFFSSTALASLARSHYGRRLAFARSHPNYEQASFKAQLILRHAKESAGFFALYLIAEWTQSDGCVFEPPGLEGEINVHGFEALKGLILARGALEMEAAVSVALDFL